MKTCLFAWLALVMPLADAELLRLDIKPSQTDPAIQSADSPHIVQFDPAKTDATLLLWMPGTLGSPHVPRQMNFPQFAAQQGYRLINLSYITDQAVSGICVGKNLRGYRACAEDYRRKRIFGDGGFRLIPDQPQDAIVHRFSKLLQYLKEQRKDEHWDQYLNADGSPRWEKIAVSGQSQGGGHAAFIAKLKPVARVIMLSGGWDYSAPGEIADWYAKPSVTPPERWYATYHVEEPTANAMAEISRALKIPQSHVGALDKPVLGARAHGEGMSNPAYLPWWKMALGEH